MDGERRDDWSRGVDENLASLNAGQRVWERDLELLHKLLGDIDRLLRGDPDRDTSGVVSRLEAMERDLAKINAVLFVDSTGKKGLVHEVQELSVGERTVAERWKFATAIVVAFLSLLGLLLTNWDHVMTYLSKHSKTDPLERAIEQSKHPRKRHVVVHVMPTLESDDEENQ